MDTIRDAARIIAQLPRRRRTQPCQYCGRLYQAGGRGQYCSQACRQQAYRVRLQREEQPTTDDAA